MHTEQFRRFIRGCSDVNVAGWSVASRHDETGWERELVQAPETSGWLWQFKSYERGERRRDAAGRPYRAAARLESPRARASIISGKFQTGSRGLASAEAAGKSVNVGGSFEKDPLPLPLPLHGWRWNPPARRERWCVETGEMWKLASSSSKATSNKEFSIFRKEYTTFPIFGTTSGPRVILFTSVKFFYSDSNDSYQICI